MIRSLTFVLALSLSVFNCCESATKSSVKIFLLRRLCHLVVHNVTEKLDHYIDEAGRFYSVAFILLYVFDYHIYKTCILKTQVSLKQSLLPELQLCLHVSYPWFTFPSIFDLSVCFIHIQCLIPLHLCFMGNLSYCECNLSIL